MYNAIGTVVTLLQEQRAVIDAALTALLGEQQVDFDGKPVPRLAKEHKNGKHNGKLLHWTQKPENHRKLMKVVRKMQKAKAS